MAICLLFALLYCELISFSKLFPSVITGCGSPWWVLSAPTSLSSFPCPHCCEFGGPTGSTSFGGQHLLVGSVTHATDQGTSCRLLGFSVGCYWHVQALLAWSCTGARAACGILSFCCKTHGLFAGSPVAAMPMWSMKSNPFIWKKMLKISLHRLVNSFCHFTSWSFYSSPLHH